MVERGTLLVVGSNPPARTSGQRTLGRVQQAATILGFESAVLANLFALPTYRSGGVSDLGGEPNGWVAARAILEGALGDCSGVLLAYGVVAPTGPARAHHREQVQWLEQEIERRFLPTWRVGHAPRHPSRWQRYTWREFSGRSFSEALREAIVRREGSSTDQPTSSSPSMKVAHRVPSHG